MKFNNIKLIAVAIMVSAISFSCSNDDDVSSDDDAMTDDGMVMEPDFSGTFVQEDHMGRPGINTVLSNSSIKNSHNVTIPSNMEAQFQSAFLDQAVALHTAFGVEYETNILNLDAVTLTTILANDVLQVAPDGATTYFGEGGVLTGRNLTDDVIDISLILLFGGEDGNRFNGQEIEADGSDDDDDDSNNITLPILVTDNVDASGETPLNVFPYLEAPHN